MRPCIAFLCQTHFSHCPSGSTMFPSNAEFGTFRGWIVFHSIDVPHCLDSLGWSTMALYLGSKLCSSAAQEEHSSWPWLRIFQGCLRCEHKWSQHRGVIDICGEYASNHEEVRRGVWILFCFINEHNHHKSMKIKKAYNIETASGFYHAFYVFCDNFWETWNALDEKWVWLSDTIRFFFFRIRKIAGCLPKLLFLTALETVRCEMIFQGCPC